MHKNMSSFIHIESKEALQELLAGKSPLHCEEKMLQKTIKQFLKDKPKMLGFTGHIKNKPYCVQECGRYGDCMLDMEKLYQNELVVKSRSGKIILKKPITQNFINFITKRSLYEIQDQDIKDLRELVNKTKMPPHTNSIKHKIIMGEHQGKGNDFIDKIKHGASIIFVYSVEDLFDKFQSIISHIEFLGNDNKKMANEAMCILDELLKLNEIDKFQHKNAMKKFLPSLL